MKFHFMLRGLDTNPKSLKDITVRASEAGFYSMLMTYHSRQEDFWIKSAKIIDDSIKMKMMIAIRTYAISPEYCAMMVAASNSLSKNKIVLNVVAGDLHKDETSVADVIDINDLIATSQDRVAYTTKWLDKFRSLDIIKNQIPEIVISGTSEKSINNLIKYMPIDRSSMDMLTPIFDFSQGQRSYMESFNNDLNINFLCFSNVFCSILIYLINIHIISKNTYDNYPKTFL